MTDAEFLRIWNTLTVPRRIDARVFSCAVSAYENNGEIDTGRAMAVLQIVWPGVAMGNVPYEIRERTANQNQNRIRQADFVRFTELISGALDVANRGTDPQNSSAQDSSAEPPPAAIAQAGAGFGTPAENKLVETAAVQAVMKGYQDGGWSVRSVERDKCGFDLECTKGATVEEVEVKGVSGTELSFIITAREVKQARENPKFVLFVVTSALSPSPTLTKFSGQEFVQLFDLTAIQYRASLKR